MNNSFSNFIKVCTFSLIILLLVGQISACGQKGALYLPDDKEKVETESSPQPAESDKDKTQ